MLTMTLLAPSWADEGAIFGGNDVVDMTPPGQRAVKRNSTSMAPTASPKKHSKSTLSNDDDKVVRTSAPTVAPTTGKKNPSMTTSSTSASWFFYTCILLLLVLGAWITYGYCRKKRELRMLDERSRAADRVLGDMQMIPQDDYDNEII